MIKPTCLHEIGRGVGNDMTTNDRSPASPAQIVELLMSEWSDNNDGGQAALELLERVEEISPDETGPVSLTDVGKARIAEVFNRHLGQTAFILALASPCISMGILFSTWLAACRRNITQRLWMATRFSGSFLAASRLPPPRCGC